MGGTGSPGRPGSAGRYLSGLGAAGFGLCAASWLVLTPFAFGYRGHSQDAAVTNLVTGGGLAMVCLVTLVATTVAWRRALRADGVLAAPSPGRVRRRLAREAVTGPAAGLGGFAAALAGRVRELYAARPGAQPGQ